MLNNQIMKKFILFTIIVMLGMSLAIAAEYSYHGLVREGVTWVNEKVIIDHGDTTRFYYKYEFRGEDTLTNFPGDINQACYYYTGESLDTEQDSLIAGLSNGFMEITCYRNLAYVDARHNDRLLFELAMYLDGGTRILYSYGDYFYDDGTQDNWLRLYYLAMQHYWWEITNEEGLLTKENFVMVEPIEIDGISCERAAYINEQGDTMCYVVETIGFDSYNMGDLLTPFMRQPDPNADYQEYCGLSHVIKDGKIIYKGLRYRDGAFDGIDEVAAEQRCVADGNYYDLMGRPVGKEVPTTPGIYIHNGQKIVVR